MTNDSLAPRLARPARSPSRTAKISEHIARQILRDIQVQGLVPGDRLPSEAAMLDRFDIGRGSLREALRILEVNGLVTIKTGPGGGPVVASSDAVSFGQMWTLHLQSIGATYRQLLEARCELESMLARRAAEIEGEEPAEMVRAALDEGEKPMEDDSTYAAVTSGFHATVCLAGDNLVLALAANSIQSIWSQRVTSVLFAPEERPSVHAAHQEITRAIEKHDGRRAEELMREHLQHYQDYCERRYPARMDDVVDWS
ncbi:FadR/GntR family transcriptional regulator [Nocardioides caldifontis]|uniref:FadR/GntR family transcriptional regulator n=1 Tax=Nocardioides caldifontis TaxID=2588938 RepID=UPI0011DF013A|nr:FCD domain-containing protein [Nocardioides caldifontis]